MNVVRPLLPALAFGLACCGKAPIDPPPVPLSTATAGLITPLYQSGSRLKVRWAESVDEGASVRVPIGIFDAKLGRDCELGHGPGDSACIPVADVNAEYDDIAYLDAEETAPVLLVDRAQCHLFGPPEPDRRLWALPHHRGGTPNRHVLDEPRYAFRLWMVEGSGCTPTFAPRWQARCVRPFRPADLHDVVETKEMTFGLEGDGSGIIVAVGADGSVLPLGMGAEYFEAANDVRCAVNDDACFPRWTDWLDETPSVGAELKVTSHSKHARKWGHRYGEDVWAALTPAPRDGARVGMRTVTALLPRDQALRFAPFAAGRGRIVVHGKTMPDGRRVPLSLHDTHLRRDCAPTVMDDGRWRCTVQLPGSCQQTFVGEGEARTEAISPSSSFCREPETCCQGGPIWFPRIAARGPRRFDIAPDLSPRPAVPGRAVRFSETPRLADHVAMWVPRHRALVYDKVEDLGPDTFAEIRVVQDR